MPCYIQEADMRPQSLDNYTFATGAQVVGQT